MNIDINVLFTSRDSIYKELDLQCWDIDRNALNFDGDGPIIAHPPCRGWSNSMRKLAKPRKGERSLFGFALRKLITNGGVIEHPYLSLAWRYYKPHRFGLKTVQCDQQWFGHVFRKRTWLLMPESYDLEEFPFFLCTYGNSYRQWANIHPRVREQTPLEFATYLIRLIRRNVTP